MDKGGGNNMSENPEIIKSISYLNNVANEDISKINLAEVTKNFGEKINKSVRIGRGSDLERKGITPIKSMSPTIVEKSSPGDTPELHIDMNGFDQNGNKYVRINNFQMRNADTGEIVDVFNRT